MRPLHPLAHICQGGCFRLVALVLGKVGGVQSEAGGVPGQPSGGIDVVADLRLHNDAHKILLLEVMILLLLKSISAVKKKSAP